MKILVTGGSGFLGSHVISSLKGDNFSRRTGKDILNLLDAREVVNYDVVVHLAAHLDKSPGAAEEVFLNNVEGTINLLKSMKEGSVFIFASTKDVYGRFADKYEEVPEGCPTIYSGQNALEWSKLIAEKYVSYYGNTRNFRTCIFRMSTVYAPHSEGNNPNFVTFYADALNQGNTVRLPGEGKPVRDLLHVDDFSAACTAFIDSVVRHGIYNLGGGRSNSLSLRDLFEKLQEVSGYQAAVDEANPLPAPVPLNYVSDIGLIATELGWSPSISLDDGLKTLFGKSV